MDMRSLSLPPAFDVIYSWDGFFHLSPTEQRLALPAICKLLSSQGRLMLTIGDEEGEAIGAVYGGPVFHGSLSHPEYREILAAADMHMASVTSECFNKIQRNVLYASKIKRS